MPKPQYPRGNPNDLRFKYEAEAQRSQYGGHKYDEEDQIVPRFLQGTRVDPALRNYTNRPELGTVYSPWPESYVSLKDHLAAVGAMTYLQRLGMQYPHMSNIEGLPERFAKTGRETGGSRIPMREMKVLGGISKSIRKNERRKNAKESD